MNAIMVKEHFRHGQLVLAACDAGLVGRKFEENGVILDLASGFYQGSIMDCEKFGKKLDQAYIANLVGKQTIEFAKKRGLVADSGTLHVNGVPHAQVLNLRNQKT